MSVNKDRPHVLVLPEDAANRQIAVGFSLCLDFYVQRQMQVLNEVGGWTKVLSTFESDHIAMMDRTPNRNLILLIDFDDQPERLGEAQSRIPERLRERVFILGALSTPERLKNALGTYEQIGTRLAESCRSESDAIWEHELLRHNAGQLTRLRERVRPILFGSHALAADD